MLHTEIKFIKGERYTVISINEMLCSTQRNEIEITGDFNGRTGYKHRGKRKEFYLKLKSETLLFRGWDLPIKADTDSSAGFAGNACYNLVANSPEELKTFLHTSLIDLTQDMKAKVFYISMTDFKAGKIHNGQLLYPEIETHHAVINRHKDRLEKQG